VFSINQDGSLLRVETAAADIAWDARRGGQITRFALKDSHTAHPLLTDDVWPGLRIVGASGEPLDLGRTTAPIAVVRAYPDAIEFHTEAALGDGAVRVRQEWEVYAEGAIFCEFQVRADAPNGPAIVEASMTFPLDLGDARSARWGYISRAQTFKRDPYCIHAMPDARSCLTLDETLDERQLAPLVGLSLGWDPARFFSNRLEFFIEDWTPLGDGPVSETRTLAGREGDRWRLQWKLYEGAGLPAGRRIAYRNRWGVCFGAARTRSGPDADPARRNNLLGARIVHCGYPYLRKSRDWPWRAMPPTQSPYHGPQYFAGLPSPDKADEAAEAGADVMVLHQFWMTNPGSNNEPPADYRARDADWLRAFVGRCRERGMRVALYMRGTEPYSMYSDFFEEFLEKDRDGLYVDWNGPLYTGWQKASSLHFSAYHYFLFTRALRHRVGEGGPLVAHSAMHTQLALTHFDACLSGEGAEQRDALLTDPRTCAYYGMQGGCGVHLIAGNPYDRKLFGTPRAAAYCAALGINAHTSLGGKRPCAETAAYMRPLWRVLLRLPGRPARLFSPAVGTGAAACAEEGVFCVAHQDADGNTVLLVTNLSDEPKSAEVALDRQRLGLPASAVIEPCPTGPPAQCSISNGVIRIRELPPMAFRGFEAKNA